MLAEALVFLLKSERKSHIKLQTINYTNVPAYNLAKYIDNIIRTQTKFKNHMTINNNIELVQKIKEKHVPHNSTLETFDITNVYTSVLISATQNN